MNTLLYRKSTANIRWCRRYGGWKMKVDIAGSILLVVLIVFLLLMNFAKPATCMYISRTYVHNKYFTQPICQI